MPINSTGLKITLMLAFAVIQSPQFYEEKQDEWMEF
jgi:hypothetical protein